MRVRECPISEPASACNGDSTETAPCPSESTNQPPCQNVTHPGDFFTNLFSMDNFCDTKVQRTQDLYTQEIINFPFLFIFTGAGTWAEWGEWSGCNPSSSNGNKFRFRNCNNAPSADVCDGDPTETASCSSGYSLKVKK